MNNDSDHLEAQMHTILIVDDSEEDRYLLKRFLTKTKLSLLVLEATNGKEALDLLTTPKNKLAEKYPTLTTPVVIFLDINMPIMDGWEFVKQLDIEQEKIELRPTVVMMYSTASEEDEKKKINEFACVDGYLVKGESTPENIKQTILDSVSSA